MIWFNRLLALFGCSLVLLSVLVSVRTVADAAKQKQNDDAIANDTDIAKKRIKNKCRKVTSDLQVGGSVQIVESGKPTGRYLPPGTEVCDSSNATAKLQSDPQGVKGVGYVMSIERLESKSNGTDQNQEQQAN